MTVCIDLRDVRKLFGPTLVLSAINCGFEIGAITAVLGANGAGKSTLLKIMGGVLAPTSGSVTVGPGHRAIRTVRDAVAADIRFIHQEGSLIPAWTVAEHFRVAQAWKELAPGVAGSTRVEHLNGHDRQLIEVARALQGAPLAILADEPTAGLSPAERDRVFAGLRAAAARGGAVVMVTHDLEAALSVADRVIVLRGGQIARDAAAADLSRNDILDAMGVAVGEQTHAPAAASAAAPIFAVAPRPGAEAIDLTPGVITGVIGGPFSGAAEALRAASGLPPLGSIGNPVKVGRRIAYLSREMAEWDFPGLSVRFNLNAATLRRLAQGGVMRARAEQAQAQALREDYRVTAPSLDLSIEQLSGGNRQKAALARLAATGPDILILDEPFSGVDAPTRLVLGQALRRLAGEGMAIGIYSQELPDLIAAADRIAVAGDDGRLTLLDAAGTSPAMIEAVLADHALKTRETQTAP
jgi:ribose transport system ATP-binding protein